MSNDIELAVEGLSLQAGGVPHGRVLFEELHFAVRASQRWVVLGPNGAGKSSLLAALAGVFPLLSGHVLLQARALTQWRLQELAHWRAWCPQFWFDPFPATVAETATLATRRQAWWQAAAQDDGALTRMLDALQLQGLADADVRTLSGGERQRVAIATALLQNTRVVLLDEPVSHLDLARQQLVLQLLIRASAEGQAIVASLHDLNLAWALATHAVLLDGRGVAVAGPRDEVMTPAQLSHAFGVEVRRVEVDGSSWFRSGVPMQQEAG